MPSETDPANRFNPVPQSEFVTVYQLRSKRVKDHQKKQKKKKEQEALQKKMKEAPNQALDKNKEHDQARKSAKSR